MTFWQNASTEQKLVQVKAGIALGMTSKQIAMNVGAPIRGHENAVKSFADAHGLRFGRSHDKYVRAGKAGAEAMRVTMSRRVGTPEIQISDAFDIFPRSERDEFSLFEERYA